MDKAAAHAEKFGDLITADVQVLNEGWDSRNNHRYPVVVQDSATQSILLLYKTQTALDMEKSFRKAEYEA